MKPRILVPGATCVLLLALGGCQKLLDFQEFETGGPTTADAGASNGGGPSQPGTGTGTSGVECDATADCSKGLVCLYGFCRKECTTDLNCEQDSVCLFSSDGSGCRLASETCDQGVCPNANLVCGLDATCRIACGNDNSCDTATQRCIAGTCVSTVGANSTSWECGGIEDGQVTCVDGALSVCNVTAPGLASIEDCGSTALCEQSLPADATYDAEAPPSCASGCAAAMPYCSGSKLLVCKDDGSGPVGAGADCATKELCTATAKAGEKKCRAPVCDANEVHCTGGETELSVERCAAGRDKFTTLSYCEKATPQCNPGASACVELKVDAKEVTAAQYQTWIATTPSTAGQPMACKANSFAPDATCLAKADDGNPLCTNCAQPITCVDWCDAYAYCASHGQHLCGKIGGGMNPFTQYADPGSSEWMNGCSAAGKFDWAGGAKLPSSGVDDCTYSGLQVATSYLVGTHKHCASPSPGYDALHDMSGNVEEWEDSCQKDADAGTVNDACRTRGGSWNSELEETRCDAVPASAHKRSDFAPTLGFRCCG